MDADSMIKYVIRDADGKAPGRSIPLPLEIQLMFLKHKAGASTLPGALDPLGLMQRDRLCSTSPHRKSNASEETPYVGNHTSQRKVVGLTATQLVI